MSNAASPVAVQRLRLGVVSLALMALVFAQSAGSVAPDTKLDLVVDPLRFLTRTLTLWDPNGAAGQLQNQAYGYLFPMGPFFLLGKALSLPAWVVQRGWESALVVAAFLGMVRLARLLGMTGFWPRVATGLAYALAPRLLAELGSISSELMPMVALPWVLVPLVRGASTGSPRRAAAASGVALLFAGGVNAAATAAILPAPALWLLTRQRGPRTRALMCWWALAVVLACAWWLVPLVVLGRYSPPFLDWIESSEVTNSVTSLIASLRGADHWEGYLGPSVWPAGWIVVAAPAVIVATALVAGAGLAGLSRADLPHRVFLRTCLVLGLVLITAGYVATVGPPFAGPVRTLLDGPLNAFRNVHKFDPLIRLPVAIGLGHLLSRIRLPDRLVVDRRHSALELRPRLLAVVLVLAVGAVACAPAITNKLIPQPRAVVDTSWWRAAGAWLGDHAGDGRALVVPGASRPVYLWGSTVDDALQPYGRGPWTVRDGVPLAQAGYVRLLDDISQRLAAGRRDAVLPELLARSGIEYLVVRNDLDTTQSGSTGLAFVHATIRNSPGISLATSFGELPRQASSRRQVVDLGATAAWPQVQVYRVAAWSDEVALLPASDTVAATGSADQVGDLLSLGLGAETPILFGSDAAASGLSNLRVVTTDGIRRREARFGQSGSDSGTMTASQAFDRPRAVQDYLPDDQTPLSTYQYGGGLADVQASSSGADAGALLNVGAANGPWSAVDGDPTTSWESSALTGAVGQWLAVSLSHPIAAPTIEVAFTAGLGGYPSRVRVTTDSGSRDSDVSPGPFPQEVPVPAGETRTLRIAVLDAAPGAHAVGISTLGISGVAPTRTLVVPSAGMPALLTFHTEPGARADCLTVNGRAACDASFAASGEEDGVLDRTFTLPGAQRYAIRATLTPRPGKALGARLDAGSAIGATASSVDSTDPRERPGAAVDGDQRTSWVAQVGDQQPSLVLNLGRLQPVRWLQLTVDPGAPVARPTRIRISAGAHAWTFAVGSGGIVRLPRAVTTKTLRLTVLNAELRQTISSTTGKSRLLPAGISEITINGAPNQASAGAVKIGCSDGVDALVDGIPIPLWATATRDQLLSGAEIAATPCSGASADLQSGVHRVRLAASPLLEPDSITLARGAIATSPGDAGSAAPLHWGATLRTVRVAAAAPALLVVRENANAGWRATLGGHRLSSVRLDGWQQGWIVPAGAAGIITLSYTPQSTFEVGLLAGLLAALAVVALMLVPARRRDVPGVGDRVFGTRWLAAGSMIAAFLLAGITALAIVAAVYGLFWTMRRLGRVVPWWASGVAVVLAGCVEAYAPSGSARHPLAGSPGVQALCLAALCLMVTGSAVERRHGLEKRRSSGRSNQYQDAAPSTVAEPAVSRKYSG